jgi:hypothetical protein
MAVTFGSLSTTRTDYKTVTATCGSISLTVNVVVYELTGSLVPIDNFQQRNQTKYGLREIVDLYFITNPSGISSTQVGGLQWQKSGVGTLAGGGYVGSDTYDAGYKAGDVSLKLVVLSGPCVNQCITSNRTVVAPTGTRMTRADDINRHVNNTASVGLHLYYWLDPAYVSFSRLDFWEGAGPDYGRFGIFSGEGDHKVSHFNKVNKPSNATEGSRVNNYDWASVSNAPPFGDGGWTWDIPAQYVDESGTRQSFGSVKTQTGQVWVNGNATMTKGGASGSAAAADPSTPWP